LRAHVVPSIESEVHKALREVADQAAIEVFAENVRTLLLSAPFGPKAVLGVDPGLRTGCKLAVVDGSGRAWAGLMHLSARRPGGGGTDAGRLVDKGASRGRGRQRNRRRETEAFVREALRSAGLDQVPVVMVSESGASVYSASEVAREEFPDLDVTIRGAISIARRLQDPLAELVKIDPRSIGVGQYQHDVSPHALKKSLAAVIDSCVNRVGVNLNTASYHLLSHVAGIGPGLARAIVEPRKPGSLVGPSCWSTAVPGGSEQASACAFRRRNFSTIPASTWNATQPWSAGRSCGAGRAAGPGGAGEGGRDRGARRLHVRRHRRSWKSLAAIRAPFVAFLPAGHPRLQDLEPGMAAPASSPTSPTSGPSSTSACIRTAWCTSRSSPTGS
jgi:hypothetical protein